MRIETKLAPTQQIGISQTGLFAARVASFNTIDSYGDKLLPGAFSVSLTEKAVADKKVPILWSHVPFETPIGYCEDCVEDAEGLVVKGQLLMEDIRAKSVHTLMAKRAVTEFSFGFIAQKFTFARAETGEMIREISQVDLIEVSPVLYPANDNTELLSVKQRFEENLERHMARGLLAREMALELKAGATLSQFSRQRLEDIRTSLITAAEDLDRFLADPTAEKSAVPAPDDPRRPSLATDDEADYLRWMFPLWLEAMR